MPLSPGTRFGSFEIVAPLGAGAMGEVYRAADLRLRREVAIKVLPGAVVGDRERVVRFEREARALAAINHPHIAAIYGVEETDGMLALVLELVEGQTLAERLERGPLPLVEALTIARQIADGLDAAHARGVVHRDVKPANIKLRPDGTVKILDLGLARVRTPEVEPIGATMTADGTIPGLIVGTVPYMSPEQARGEAADQQTDIWAFGCVLYEMLSGKRAFAGASASDTLVAVFEREPDWTALRPDTPPAVQRLMRRCVEKQPKRRLHAIADARLDLDDALSTDDREGQSGFTAMPRSNRRARLRAALLFTGGAAAAAVAAYFVLNTRAANPPRPVSRTARTIATQLTNLGGTEASPSLSPDGRSFAFASDHGGTPDIWLRQVSGGEPVRLTNDSAEEADLAFAPDGDSIFFTRIEGSAKSVWRVGVLGGQPRKVLSEAWKAAPSRDGRRLAYFEKDGDSFGFALAIAALDGSAKRVLVHGVLGSELAIRPAWSPDGRSISYCSVGLFAPKNLMVVDVASAEARQVTHFTGSNEGIDQHVWLSDNRHVVVAYVPASRQLSPQDLGILDLRDGSIERLTMNAGRGFEAPSLSSDGSRLIATATENQRELWKVPLSGDPGQNGRAAVRILDSNWAPMWIFGSRNGRTLLLISPASGSLNVWSMRLASAAVPTQITAVPGDAIAHASLSPDGTHVAFASIASGSSDIWTQNVDGTDLRQLTDDADADAWPAWSPDGQWIMFNSLRDGRHATWRIRPDGTSREKVIDGLFRGDWIAKPDGAGTWVVTSGIPGGGARLWDVEQRKTVWQWNVTERLALPVFSPDGRTISMTVPETRDRDAIWLIDPATGQRRVGVKFPDPFRIVFRAVWTDEGKSLVVNRQQTISHIVLFDRFWAQ